MIEEVRDFYVSQIRGRGYRLLAGPYSTRGQALAVVAEASRRATDGDPWSDFDSFGTCSRPRSPVKTLFGVI